MWAPRLGLIAERGLEGGRRVRDITVRVIGYVQWQGAAAVVPVDRGAGGIRLDPVGHLGHEVRVVASAAVRAWGIESPLGQADFLVVRFTERGEPVQAVPLECLPVDGGSRHPRGGPRRGRLPQG